MARISLLAITLLLTNILAAETSYISDGAYFNEDSYYHENFSRDQDMHFPDPDGGKMTKTEKGAEWKGKKGNCHISVSIDDIDPHAELKAKLGRKSDKDEKHRN